MTRHAKMLNPQLNLLLVDAPKTVISDDRQKELTLALVELLISAARENNLQVTSGGRDEFEAYR